MVEVFAHEIRVDFFFFFCKIIPIKNFLFFFQFIKIYLKLFIFFFV